MEIVSIDYAGKAGARALQAEVVLEVGCATIVEGKEPGDLKNGISIKLLQVY